MKNTVEQILNAEEKAKLLLEEANKKASTIKTEADKAFSCTISSAKEKAVADSRQILELAKQKASLILEEAAKDEIAKAEDIAASKSNMTADLVEKIINLITGTGKVNVR